MEAGKLRERVAFDKRTIGADDGYGNTVQAWAKQFETSAGYSPLRGSEPVIAARLSGVQPNVIRTRFFSRTAAVDESWRIRDLRTGAIYNIRSIIKDVKRAFIDFTCEAGVADG